MQCGNEETRRGWRHRRWLKAMTQKPVFGENNGWRSASVISAGCVTIGVSYVAKLSANLSNRAASGQPVNVIYSQPSILAAMAYYIQYQLAKTTSWRKRRGQWLAQ